MAGERENFLKLVEYCRIQNSKGGIPHFVIADSPDFEYMACLHDAEYNGQDTKTYIEKNWGYKDLAALKVDPAVYDFLNTGKKTYKNLLEKLRKQDKLIRNHYEIKKKTFDITIKKTEYNADLLGRRGSNIEEFFEVIDW